VICFPAGNRTFSGTTTKRGTAEKIINVFHYRFLIVSNGREHEYKSAFSIAPVLTAISTASLAAILGLRWMLFPMPTCVLIV